MKRAPLVILISLANMGIVALLSNPAAVHAEPLTQDRVDELLQELRPDPDEAYLTIPWNTALLDAQRQAVQEQKPIFIWAMDGHPLGCT